MSKVLSTLRQISKSLERIDEDMRTEEKVYQAELADRLAKGLIGEDAIKHYNEWVIKAGMKHLMVK